MARHWVTRGCAAGRAWLWGLSLGLVSPACAGHGGTGIDGGNRDGGVGQDVRAEGGTDTRAARDAGFELPFLVAAPDIPWLEAGAPPIAPPVFTPCPEGWYETDLGGATVCEPWPAGAAEDCPPGEAHLLGSAGCAPLGGPCPAGDYPEDLPAEAPVVYVLEGASPGGDGTALTPYGTLAEALATNPAAGTMIALGRGRYAGASVPPGLTLWGACPEETVITAPAGAEYAIDLGGGTSMLARLRIEAGEARAARVQGAGAVLTLRAVEVRGATCVGVLAADEATVDAEELVIRDTAPCGDSSERQGGILALGARLFLQGSLFANNGKMGISAWTDPAYDTPAGLVLEDSIVRGHRDAQSATYAVAAVRAEGATARVTAEVRRTLLEGNRAGGLALVGEGTVGEVDRLFVRDNGSEEAIHAPFAVQPVIIDRGARALLRRISVTGTRSRVDQASIQIIRAGTSSSTLEDVVVVDNKARGLRIGPSQATFSARRLYMSTNLGGDILVNQSDLEVEDARLGGNPLREWGSGEPFAAVVVGGLSAPGHIDLKNTAVVDGAGTGVYLTGSSASASLEDVAIVGTTAFSGGGWGITGAFGPRVTGWRLLLEGNHLAALELRNGAGSLELEDAVLRDTEPYPEGDEGGRGIVLSEGSTGHILRTRVDGTYELGVVGFGSTVALEDVEVRHTEAARCAGRGACLAHGHLLGVYSGATFTMTRFVLAGAAACGVHFARESEVDLTDGLVTGTRIGACVQVDGYDYDRLSNGVYYLDNEQNLAATELPVPDPGG